MLKTEENSDLWTSDFGLNDDSDNFSMDIDKFFAILSEETDPSSDHFLNNSEYLLSDHFQAEVPHVEVNHVRSSQPQNDNSDTVEHEKPETVQLTESPLHSSVSLAEWSTSYAEHFMGSPRERVGSSINAHLHSNADSKMLLDCVPKYSMALNFVAGQANHASSRADYMDFMQLKSETGFEFKHDGGDSQPKLNLMVDSANHTTLSESCMNDLETCKRDPCTTRNEGPSRSVEMALQNVTQSDFNNDSEVSGVHCESSNYYSEACSHFGSVVDNEPFSDPSKQFPPHTFVFPALISKRENMAYEKDDVGEALTGASLQESTLVDCTSIGSCQGTSFKWEDGSPSSPIQKNSFDTDEKTSAINSSQSLVGIPSLVWSKGEIVCIEDGRHDKLLASKSKSFSSHSSNFMDVPVADTGSPVSDISAFGADHASSDLMHIQFHAKKKPTLGIKDEQDDKLILHRSMTLQAAKLTGEVWGSRSICSSHIDVDADADADICILEDISGPRRPPSIAPDGKSFPVVLHGRSGSTSQPSAVNNPHHQTGMGGTRPKINDERLTFRAALQGLSQPKAEAAPPEGVLAVSLLRHQRIALSWMTQKETASLHCSGGILADDQGLGKTISTIALILKERPPSAKMSSMSLKRDNSEALNLDDDDDDNGICQLDGSKQDGDSGHVIMNGGLLKNDKNVIMPTKGRPAAGTLIVCPTSVLRQWADELHNKVTRDANLSVLVYHGSNRTKDPLELTKYDVVLTTYSIVSLEVPKQPLVDKDDDDKGKQEGPSAVSVEFSSSRKRKYAPGSDKKSGKNKKGVDNALLEAVARPLARVGWFRVVLDEAQSIKNHRTQVARACWGLRAKRRWCLSGTPIQNAVDDLYSYFRFLRYDPYAVYKSFCSMIKVPITRNPTNGYKKLQLVLKTIMLRRTKGTLLDGQPIITLPPKSVELKKVDFSKEERDFYSKLEADSRAQFKVYAEAGTVKQNYVNILLMLLRLRQACDHPLLVRGYDSNSVWSSSIQMAKKLPREKQKDLLNCLEASLAICGICSDPPEDAVVTICGHVFCNQCVCEHLTSDDRLCPAGQCKFQLNVTSVFSRATLKSSLFDEPDQCDSADKFTSPVVETLEPFSEGHADSSKIKAAIDILQSISKPRHYSPNSSALKSKDEIPIHIGNNCDSLAVGSFKDIPKLEHDETEKLFDDSSNKAPEKAIVFSQWTRMLDLLESRLKESSIQYRRLDGTMSVVARDKAVKDFNTIPEVSVMIMSLKAASLGLNMVAACHVLLLDLWWNPTTEDQAIDRAHRIGQTRPVTVLRLTVKDTVEDRILALQQKKREMVASAFGEDETGGRQTRLTVEDLSYLFMV